MGQGVSVAVDNFCANGRTADEVALLIRGVTPSAFRIPMPVLDIELGIESVRGRSKTRTQHLANVERSKKLWNRT